MTSASSIASTPLTGAHEYSRHTTATGTCFSNGTPTLGCSSVRAGPAVAAPLLRGQPEPPFHSARVLCRGRRTLRVARPTRPHWERAFSFCRLRGGIRKARVRREQPPLTPPARYYAGAVAGTDTE